MTQVIKDSLKYKYDEAYEEMMTISTKIVLDYPDYEEQDERDQTKFLKALNAGVINRYNNAFEEMFAQTTKIVLPPTDLLDQASKPNQGYIPVLLSNAKVNGKTI
jgi:hypothetical protein